MVTDEQQVVAISRQLSPIYFVTAQTPPVLIYHGDCDQVVPLSQSKALIEALKRQGIRNKLQIKPGAAHGWKTQPNDVKAFANWFDSCL